MTSRSHGYGKTGDTPIGHKRAETSSSDSDVFSTQDLQWGGIVFLPFNRTWQILVGVTTVFVVFAAIYDAVYYHINPGSTYMLVRFLFDLIYLIDTSLYAVHRAYKSLQETRVYLPKKRFPLFIDFFSLIPLELLYQHIVIDKPAEWPNMASYLRIIVILRVYRLEQVFNHNINILNSNEIPTFVCGHLCLHILMTHVFAALWYAVGCKPWQVDCDPYSWTVYMDLDKEFDPNDDYQWFLWCFFYICALFTHNWSYYVRSENVYERWIVIVALLCGAVLYYALLCGKLITMFMNNNKRHFQFVNNMQLTKRRIRNWDATPDNEKRVFEYYEAFWKHRSGIKETAFFGKLPLALQKDVSLDLFWESFMHSHLFREMDLSFKRTLSCYMKSEFLLPGEYIYKIGDTKSKMFYIVTGVVQVLSDEDCQSPVASFSSGTLLGEITTLIPMKSTTSARCVSCCELHSLDALDLYNSLHLYPEKAKVLRANILNRIHFCRVIMAHKVRQRSNASVQSNDNRIKTVIHSDMHWLKERYQRLRAKDLLDGADMDYEDDNYWQREEEKTPEEVAEYTSRYVDLYAFSDEVELKTDIVCLKTTFPWILEPNSGFLLFWKILMLLVVALVCLTYPYYIGFVKRFEGNFLVISIVFRLFYLVDLWFQATTAIKTKGVIITDMWSIIRYRMKQISFLVDLVSTLPFYVVLYQLASLSSEQATLGHGIQLLRVYHIHLYLKDWEKNIWVNMVILRIVRYTIMVIIWWYWVAAILYIVACPATDECRQLSWYTTKGEGNNERDELFDDNLQSSLRLSLDLLTRIGIYHVDIQTNYEIYYCVFAMMFGATIYSIFYSELTATWIMKAKQRSTYQSLIMEMKRFTMEHKIVGELKRRTEWFLVFQWEHSYGANMLNRRKLLTDAPTELREAIVHNKVRELILGIPLFQEVNLDFVNKIIKSSRSYALPPQAHITVPGIQTNTLIIIRKGYCVVKSLMLGDVTDNRETIAGPGSHFPVLALLQRLPVFVSVRTLTACEVIALDYTDLVKIMELYPSILDDINTVINLPELDNDTIKVMNVKNAANQTRFKFADTKDPGAYTLEKHKMEAAELRAEYEHYMAPFLRLGHFAGVRYLLQRQGIHPGGRFIKCWEISRIFFAVCTLILVPMTRCALAQFFYLHYVVLALDFTAYADLYVRLNVGYYNELGILVSHPRYTAHHYLTHAFITDFFGCFPFQWVPVHILFGERPNQSLHYTLMCSRLFQFYRIHKFCIYLESNIQRNGIYISFLRLLMTLLLVVHCLGNILPFYNCYIRFDDLTKEFIAMDCSITGWMSGTEFELGKQDTLRAYILSVYWFVNLFTLNSSGFFGYEEMRREAWFLFMCVAIGLLRLVFMAAISSMKMVGNVNLTEYREQMKCLVSFLKQEDTRAELVNEAIEHFEYNWAMTRGMDVYNVFSMFHSALQEDITYQLYGETLKLADIFAGAEEMFFRSISKHVRVVYLNTGAHVERYNQYEDTIYIINNGRINVYSYVGQKRAAVLMSGCVFGNLDRNKCPARYRAVAKYRVELFAISNTVFYSILDQHPNVRTTFEKALDKSSCYIMTSAEKYNDVDDNEADTAVATKRIWRLRSHLTKLWKADSTIYKCWLAFIKYFCSLVSTLLIAFLIGYESDAAEVVYPIYFFDCLFLLKFYVEFNTAYIDNDTGLLVTNRRLIAKKYIRSWLVFDLVCNTPIEFVAYIFEPEKNENQDYLLCVMRLNRLLRIVYIIQFFVDCLARVKISNWIIILQALTGIFLTLEMTAAFYLMVACPKGICQFQSYFSDTIDEQKLTSSVSYYGSFSVAHLYSASLFSGIPLRDIKPANINHVMLAICTCIGFIFMLALFICYIANYIEISTLTKSNFEHEVLMLKDYLKDRDVSPYLLEKTLTFTVQLWLRAKGEWLPALLQAAPTALREDLMNSLYSHHLRSNALFNETHEDFLCQLTAAFDRCVFFPGDCIVEKGDVDGNMYFIHEGAVEVFHRNKYYVETVIGHVDRNGVFSTAQGLYKNEPHVHIYKARTLVDLLILNQSKLEAILKIFPAARSEIYGKARRWEFT